MPEGGIPVTPNPYSSTVALVSTIFALFSEVTGAPEEDSSTGIDVYKRQGQHRVLLWGSLS